MKFLNGLIFLNYIFAGKSTCDINDLTKPMNAKKWNCTGAVIGNSVQAGNKCTLECAAGYSQTICKLTFNCTCDK